MRGKSGDLLLFSCNDTGAFLPGWLRKIPFRTEWTHASILYIDPMTKIPYIWESTTLEDNVIDKISREKQRKGAQLVKLEDRLKEYNGYCVVKFICPSFAQTLGEEELNKRFDDIFKRHADKRFNDSYVWIALLIIIDFLNLHPNERAFKNMRRWICKKNSLICTELVSNTYRELGMWDHVDYTFHSNKKYPGTFLPHHFAMEYNLGDRKIVEEYEISV